MNSAKSANKSQASSAVESNIGKISMSSDWHRLSQRLSVRFSFKGMDSGLTAEWDPKRPSREDFLRARDAYSRARNEFLNQLSARLGKRVLCLVLPI
jgi:hypothetical protein